MEASIRQLLIPTAGFLNWQFFQTEGKQPLVADVRIGDGKGTVNTHLGDWLGWLALAGLIFFSFGGEWLKKKAKAKSV